MLLILLLLNSLEDVVQASTKVEEIKKKYPYAKIVIRVQEN